MPWKLKQDSAHKLIAWFNDGNSVTRYSLDWKHQLSKNHDPDLGLEKLRNLISKYGSNAWKASIYVNKPNKEGQEIERYHYGIKTIIP